MASALKKGRGWPGPISQKGSIGKHSGRSSLARPIASQVVLGEVALGADLRVATWLAERGDKPSASHRANPPIRRVPAGQVAVLETVVVKSTGMRVLVAKNRVSPSCPAPIDPRARSEATIDPSAMSAEETSPSA